MILRAAISQTILFLIRSKGALANSSDELPTDADVHATYSVFVPELVEKFMEKLEEKYSDGSS